MVNNARIKTNAYQLQHCFLREGQVKANLVGLQPKQWKCHTLAEVSLKFFEQFFLPEKELY